MPKTIPPRNKVNKKYTWNAESVYKSPKEWEVELQALLKEVPNVKKHEGKLGESPAALLEGLDAIEGLLHKAQTVYMYAQFSYAVDTANQASAGMVGKAQSMYGQVAAATAFLN